VHLASLLKEDGDWWVALGALLGALLLAFVVDRAFSRRATALTDAVTRGHMSRETATRLRFVRRVIYAVILLIGVGIALSQFEGVDKIATSLLASGVVAAAVIGFAARQVLANFVAGVMLAITQPLRVGDWVTFEDQHGVVEDVRLNFTVLRAGETRIVIPNEKLAAGILQNDTLRTDDAPIEVSVWLPANADLERAAAILGETASGVAVAELAPGGARLSVSREAVPAAERGPAEADLRAHCHARLRAEGLLEGFTGPDRTDG
jgi:small-conductance mechanosensitive channel